MDLEIRNKILNYLRTNNSASASDIAKKIKHNRITIGKYLQILEAQKLVTSKKVASAIYWEMASSKPRILIVDDEEHIVELIKLSLGDTYDLYAAFDGNEALRLVEDVLPNVIILDIMMPGKDGFEVCDEIKKNLKTQEIPVVFLSAKGGVEDKVKAMGLGAEDYLVKPFDPLELEARIASIIRRMASLNTKNNITNLPNKLFTEEMRSLWKQKNYWFEYIIKLDNFSAFIESFGHKKSYEVIQFLSKMLLEIIDNDDFLGHNEDSQFVIFSENQINLKKFQKRFSEILPFFYLKETTPKIEVFCEEIKHA